MTVTDSAALGFRVVILAGHMIAAALSIVRAVEYRRQYSPQENEKGRRLKVLAAGAVTLYGTGAFYGTWMRLESEFSFSLPLMGIGILMFCAYLKVEGATDPKAPPIPLTEQDKVVDRLLRK